MRWESVLLLLLCVIGMLQRCTAFEQGNLHRRMRARPPSSTAQLRMQISDGVRGVMDSFRERWCKVMARTATAAIAASLCTSSIANLFPPMIAHATENEVVIPKEGIYRPPRAVRPFAYSVEMLNPPILQPRSHPRGENSLSQRLSQAQVLLFGEHQRESPSPSESLTRDRKLALELIRRAQQFGRNRPVALYIQALPRTSIVHQALQKYMATSQADLGWSEFVQEVTNKGAVSTEDIVGLQPLFEYARINPKLLILEPVGLPPSISQRVLSGGLEALSEQEKQSLIKNPAVFAEVPQMPGYAAYAEDVLNQVYQQTYQPRASTSRSTTTAPSGSENKGSGEGNQDTKQQRNFVSTKMLEQHFVASILSEAVLPPNDYETEDQEPSKDAGRLIVALLDSEDVVFGYGVEERVKLLIAADTQPQRPLPTPETPRSNNPLPVSFPSTNNQPTSTVYSVLLNPTSADGHSPVTMLNLVLRYGHEERMRTQRPIADFLWFSDYPSVKILTRMKNPINKEGEKPPGESSILGAF